MARASACAISRRASSPRATRSSRNRWSTSGSRCASPRSRSLAEAALAKRSVDLLHVTLGTTAGWRRVDDALDRRLAGLGVDVIRVGTTFGAGSAVWRYGSPALDLHQAAAVAHATSAALRRSAPTAILYSTFTALLAQPHRRPREAVWFDAPIAIARPGRRNAPLRGLERWQARRCDLLIVQS